MVWKREGNAAMALFMPEAVPGSSANQWHGADSDEGWAEKLPWKRGRSAVNVCMLRNRALQLWQNPPRRFGLAFAVSK